MVFLHFHLFLLFALGVVQCAEEYTCNEAQSIVVETTQCQSVTWLVGRLIDQANSTGSEYGPMVLPIAEQERRVTERYNLYTRGVSLSSSCRLALLDFACAEVYPRCPYAYPYTMYWPVCRSECEAVQNKCGAIPNLNCSQFQDNAYECSRLLSSSQFQIPFGSRDESAFSVYLLSTLFALALFAWWTVLFVRYHTQSTSLHTFLTVLLCMNLLADAVNTVVYRSIAANRGVGSIFQGMLVVCVQLLYDTLFIFVLLVVTKGWCVLFASLLGSEWCRYYALSILFYCTEGLLLIYNVEKTSPVLFHALCLLLFLLLAAEMAVTVHYAIFKTRMKLERMFRDGLDPYAHPT
ncbi:hypothetical protein WA556_004109 [Blastocystis sp. ATCC 50177/Nand II]